MKSLLELQDIYLNYKTENTLVEVIKGVNLKINSGENVAVVGKSGSGKTSLIMLIAGLEKATSGKIIFEDQDISTYSEDELADLRKRKIGTFRRRAAESRDSTFYYFKSKTYFS